MNPYAQSADTYLVQRVLGASPELQAALLMEAGQKFLGKAVKAMEEKQPSEVARCLSRVGEIITEATLRLNQEDGGELVQNLLKIYHWWTSELFEAARTQDAPRLRRMSHHMGEIRSAWEALHEKQMKTSQGAELQFADRVV